MAVGYESLALLIGIATILGIVAEKTRQPKVMAYIIAGLLMGPVGFDIVKGSELTSLFSELGLVFLLFLIGLEIDIDEVREVLGSTIGIAVIQMTLTFIVGFATAFLLGFDSITSVFIGAAVMFSSTALVVKILTKMDEATTLAGRLDIGVLLIQDVAVVLILALLSVNFSNPSEIIIKLVEIFAMITFIGIVSLTSSKYIFSGVLKELSDNNLAFFTHGVAWAFLFISLSSYLNLSMEIGAFLAGLGLASVPYSRELQERVRPLTDLFMAIFFINFGIGITSGSLNAYLFEAIIASVVLMAAKFIIFFLTIDRFKFTPETSYKASINMGQISEFGLILISLAITQGYVDQEVSGFISMVAILTMGTSAYLMRDKDYVKTKIQPILDYFQSEQKEDVEIERLEDHVVIIGYEENTKRICKKLSEKYQVLIIDNNPENTQKLAESEYEYIYGDFKHGEIREGANLQKAKYIISFSKEKQVSTAVLENSKIEAVTMVRATSFEDASEFYDMGADYVILENMLAGNRVSEYLELYLEDKKLFLDEAETELDYIRDEEQ